MDELREAYDKMMSGFEEFKQVVRDKDPHLYEQWHAGGLAVSGDFISMYPSAEGVFEQLVDED